MLETAAARWRAAHVAICCPALQMLTTARASNSLQVESRPGVGDFEPIDCEYGTLFYFRGNACEHYTELNVEDTTRVSFDFRVIRPEELPVQPVPTAPAHNDTARGKAAHFVIGDGRYYSRLPHGHATATSGSGAGGGCSAPPPSTASTATASTAAASGRMHAFQNLEFCG